MYSYYSGYPVPGMEKPVPYTYEWEGHKQNVLLLEFQDPWLQQDTIEILLPFLYETLEEANQSLYIIADTSQLIGSTLGSLAGAPTIAEHPIFTHPNLQLVIGVLGDRGTQSITLTYLETVGKVVNVRTQDEAFELINA